MTDPTKPIAGGGMSPPGTTTTVPIGKPGVPLTDRLALCPAVCKCKDAPGKGRDGRDLKQVCVSSVLAAADKSLDGKSIYKPEVSYDMTRTPPRPIMSSGADNQPHPWIPGWIAKWWELPGPKEPQRPPFQPGQGMIRRPDVVIVNDPTKPPTQDNIKQVVEIKFPPDKLDERQEQAYIQIAGSRAKFATLEPDDCNCDKRNPNPPTVPAPDAQSLGAAALGTALLLGLLAF